MIKDKKKEESGQVALVFIASLVIVIGAMALLIDGGRYLVMRSRARMLADAAAITGVGVLDIVQAGQGNFVLDDFRAREAADGNFNRNLDDSPDYADFSLDAVQVQGNQIRVTVTGTSAPLFGAHWGLNYSATVTSSARAGSGISGEN
jgi:hypothetical protein